MDRIQFTVDLKTGIREVDRQHARLIEIYGELLDAVEEHRSNRVMNEILARLFQYVKVHFETEEALLEEYDYPELDDHREQHRQLEKSLRRFIFRHTRGGERISAEVVDFLYEWITRHIREQDMAFVECVVAGQRAETAPSATEV